MVCRNTNTLEIEKDDDEPGPEVTVEAVWCMAVQDTGEDDHCDHSEKHEGSSERRDGLSCGKNHQEHRDGSTFGRVIKNIETGQNLKNVVPKIAMVCTRPETEVRRSKTMKEFVQNELMDLKLRTRNTQGIRDEHADGSKIGA